MTYYILVSGKCIRRLHWGEWGQHVARVENTHTQTLPKCSYHSQTHVHIFKALKDRKTPFSHINQIKTNGFVLFSRGELGRLFASRLYEPEMYIVREALCWESYWGTPARVKLVFNPELMAGSRPWSSQWWQKQKVYHKPLKSIIRLVKY